MDEVAATRAYLLSTGLTEDDADRYLAGLDRTVLAEARVFPPGDRVRLADACAALGLGHDDVAPALEVLGFGSEPDVLLTADEAKVLEIYAQARQLFGDEATGRFGRVVNAAMGRVAESAVSVFGIEVEDAQTDTGLLARTQTADLGFAALERLPELFAALFRRQVVAAVERLGRAHGRDADHATVTMSVGFADLVGSTAWSRRLTPRETAEALGELERLALHSLTPGARVVKTIGDEVMYAATSAAEAATIARRLLAAVGAEPRLPQVRVGIAHGRVVAVDGDLHGPVVSLAARLTAAAEPGTALLDPTAGGADGVDASPLAPRSLAGFDDPVVPYLLH